MTSNTHDTITHEFASVNGIRMHYARAGEGPLIVFLHGFPQCWYEFRNQLEEFSSDHLAISADLRGYNLTSKPESLRDAGVLHAVEDLRQLVVEHLGYDRFVLVGHDWGGAVGWSFALHHPELLDRLVVLSTPHPALFERELRESPEQQEASAYMLALRSPEAERLAPADDYRALRVPFEELGFMPKQVIDAYVEGWKQPGALSGMFSYYRREGLGPESEGGAPAHGDFAREAPTHVVEVPTLVLYTEEDLYTRPGSHRGLERYVPDLTFESRERGSHWIVDEFPEWVNEQVRDFLGRRGATRARRTGSPAPG